MVKIIADLCQNHKGDRTILKDMVWAAAGSGADYAKIQSIQADELTFRERFEEGSRNGDAKSIKRPYQSEYTRLKPMDLDEDAHRWFIAECARAGIKPLTTVFTRSAIPFVAGLGLKEVKVASYDCASYPMLRELRARFDHLYISTGATYDEEVERAAEQLAGHSFTFLHCVTVYPTPLDKMNLARLSYLRRFTPSVGFSDHSLVSQDGIKAAAVALSLGVGVIERHFTILPVDATKDGPVSIDPKLMRDLVTLAHLPLDEVRRYVKEEIQEANVMIGEEHRELTDEELLNRDYYRGRFASRLRDEYVYNWEDKPLN